jgi:hypothetical protein
MRTGELLDRLTILRLKMRRRQAESVSAAELAPLEEILRKLSHLPEVARQVGELEATNESLLETRDQLWELSAQGTRPGTSLDLAEALAAGEINRMRLIRAIDRLVASSG